MTLTDLTWRRHGLLWAPPRTGPLTTGHATVPTPVLISEDRVRVFVSCADETGRCRPFYFDANLSDAPTVVGESDGPLLELGARGCFDQDGVICTSITDRGSGELRMYYAGFERLSTVRYRIMVGIALSADGGKSFTRNSQAPALDRIDGELMFRGGPLVLPDGDGYSMIYAGGGSWIASDEKELPVYDLRVAHSRDGLTWDGPGRVIIPTDDSKHGFGRPWLYETTEEGITLLLSIRDRESGRYRVGSATLDKKLRLGSLSYGIGLEPSDSAFETRSTLFAATITCAGREWCFYNGNDFGVDGVAVAELCS